MKCVYCGKIKIKNSGISFHEFPKGEKLAQTWVKNMGKNNWIPKKTNVLCAEHFSKESIDFRDFRARLRKGSIPTIFHHDKENSSISSDVDLIVHVNKRIKLDENSKGQESRTKSSVLETRSDSNSTSPTQMKDQHQEISSGSIDVVLHDHTYSEFGDITQRKLKKARAKIAELMKSKKLLFQKNKRSQEKIKKFKAIVATLCEAGDLQADGMYSLDGFNEITEDLFKRVHWNVQSDKRFKEKYSPRLRCFALTLHFYSPKAYDYVKGTLEAALPHPSVLRSWYTTIDAEPGFSEECFNTLKLKSEEYTKQGKRLICAMIIDEMGIKSGLQRLRNCKIRGYVDIGIGAAGKFEFSVAKNALVFLVSSLDESWKLPVAFFLIDGMSSQTKTNLIKDCLIRLENVGVEVASLTLDGPAEHFATLKQLNAVMTMDSKAKPYFPHPVEGQPNVHVLVDPAHDLKNVRNTLGDWQVLVDNENNRIEWRYIEVLALLQQDEGLRLGNKLRMTHIEYKKMKMKVYLAAQTLSSSVADSIEFCRQSLGLAQFKGSEAIVKFIGKIDLIFDFLNVRNPWGKGFKSPLRRENEHISRARILDAIQYLAELKLTDNTPIFQSRRKTGFIGLYTAVLSSIALFDTYVKPEDAPLKYLLKYKVSQDHLELLFAAIRGRSGWCPNPTAAQFISAYKRLLIRHDIQIMTGNSRLMDQTKILHISSNTTKRIAKIDRYDINVYSEVENRRVEQKFGLSSNESVEGTDIIGELDDFLDFTWAIPNTLTDFTMNCVSYIAGYVVKHLSNTVKCPECVAGCRITSPITQNTENAISLILMKSGGGLIIPSDSVIAICSTAEKLFRRACNSNLGRPPIEENFPAVLANAAYRELLTSRKQLFPELDGHFNDTFSLDHCMSHMFILTKRILVHYIEIRMYAAIKNLSISITGTKIRHFLTRQIVWAHQ